MNSLFRKRALALVALISAVAFLSACDAITPYAAKVNGTIISNAQFTDDINGYFAVPELKENLDAQLMQQGVIADQAGTKTANQMFASRLLTDSINTEILRSYNKKQSLVVTDVDRANSRQLIENTPQTKLPNAVLARQIDAAAVRAVATRDYVAKNPKVFGQVCLRLVVTDTQAKADAIAGRVAAGEDFAAIARAESLASGEQGKVGSPNGGLLPCVFQEQVPQPVAQLRPGQVSAGLPTQQYGYFVFQMLEQRTNPSIDQLQASGVDLQSLVERMVPRVAKGQRIEVNPRYGTLSRQTDGDAEYIAVEPPVSHALRKGSAKSEQQNNSGDMGSILQQLQEQGGSAEPGVP